MLKNVIVYIIYVRGGRYYIIIKILNNKNKTYRFTKHEKNLLDIDTIDTLILVNEKNILD